MTQSFNAHQNFSTLVPNCHKPYAVEEKKQLKTLTLHKESVNNSITVGWKDLKVKRALLGVPEIGLIEILANRA